MQTIEIGLPPSKGRGDGKESKKLLSDLIVLGCTHWGKGNAGCSTTASPPGHLKTSSNNNTNS